MKKLFIAAMAVVLSTSFVEAQAPNKFSYQTVVRSSGGAILANTQVTVRISILKNSASGAFQYSERHNPTTNANGLVDLQIGGGTVLVGNLANINWGTDAYFIKTEIDPAGGTNYTITGTSQMLSVPYALSSSSLSVPATLTDPRSGDVTPMMTLTSSTASHVTTAQDIPGGGSSILRVYNNSNWPANLNGGVTLGAARGPLNLGTANGNMYFWTNNGWGTPAMTIGTNKSVGIGTTSPGGKLTVNGEGPAEPNTAFEIRNTTNGFTNSGFISMKNYSSGDRAMQFWTANTSATPTTDMFTFLNSTSATKILRIQDNGNVSVSGSLAKAGGSFKIDNPANPENEILYHSFVESPDMMNVYNGNVVTDASGNATVTMPDYFESLNKDFRYQLTPVGSFARVMVSKKMAGNKFTLKTDLPNVEVSWQVTGIRKDAWANVNRIPNVVEKAGKDKGKYLHPEAFGKGEDMRMPSLIPTEKP